MNRYECVLMALGLFSLHIDAQNIQNVDSIPELNEVWLQVIGQYHVKEQQEVMIL